jgi:tRNA/tmRNA/rRNA uracil-C5-methylase (TrmA/RlmC/RlmD family)
MVGLHPGERLVDLYAGVGLFGLGLAGTGPSAKGDLTLVEADRRATGLARRNGAGRPVTVIRAPVQRWVAGSTAPRSADVVVLDPPRSGAGRAVVEAVASWRPRAVAYIACDPVALARDLATFRALGFGPSSIVALDLFPTTHHVETLALLQPEPR